MVKMIDNYILKDLIGEGMYGKVYQAVNSKKEGDFAVKIIPVEKLTQNSKLQQCTFNEIRILSTIGLSPHIVRYYEMLKTKNNFYFVYQFCNGGTLLQKIKKQGCISESKAIDYYLQLLEAFKLLNKFNIMHRDLKAENIFFHNDQVKLGDFGFCKGLEPEETMTKTMLGSPIYMAPEVLRGQSYSTKADVWSLGVIFYEMLYGVCPFQSSSIAMLINTINKTQLNFPQSPFVHQETKNLIRKMLTKDYFRRIGWVQLFNMAIQKHQETALKTFSTSINRQKKSSSLPKNTKDQKVFYSKKYKDIIESINRRTSMDRMERYTEELKTNSEKQIKECQNLSNDIRQKNQLSQIDVVSNQYGEENILSYHYSPSQIKINKPSEIENKRSNLLKIHSQCIELLQTNIKILQNKEKNSLRKSCSILYKIKSKLNSITSQIKVTQINLLDISSLINFEMLQIDRQLSELKRQMSILKIDIPLQSDEIDIKRMIV